ncbi:MAG: stage V sporulation protein AC [Desulfotomaculaceae bacterium]|nr:stage V sporulation protein AC [Desulfotomaculaceae bacterium]MDD4766045.1 stage V sporulation protein AC [Desulfotomaculaceae bacterium]
MSGAAISEKQKQDYAKIVKQFKPAQRIWRNIFWAFIVGGFICLIGQFFINIFLSQGLSTKEANSAASSTLIFIAALLTGLGVYDEISRFGGAGGIVPITGFANSMVAPAMEYRAEGLIFGVGAKLFTIAGPVLVWGIFTAWAAAILYYFFK